MDAPSHLWNKHNIVISLPLLAFWVTGLRALGMESFSVAADTALTTWYFFLSFLLLELHLMQTDSHAAPWPTALVLLCGIWSGMTGSRPLAVLFPFLDRAGSIPPEYLSAAFLVLLLLFFFLAFQTVRAYCPGKLLLPGIALTVAAGIWEPARFTLTLGVFASALHSVSRKNTKAREETLCALSEAEMLTELNRMKNQSYADLSHEMKTPLTVISVNAQLAAKNLEAGILDEETITDIRIISAEASRLTQMISSLTVLGQLKGTGAGRTLIPTDELVRTTARTCQVLSERHGNVLTVAADPDLPPVSGNADRLTQVLMNLISNANRHTRNGIIAVSVKKLADRVEISVTDNGEGIEPALLPHVFERFCHGEKGNTGLGLSICKKIIDEHGGKMGIESETGTGTRVWFSLPTDKHNQEP